MLVIIIKELIYMWIRNIYNCRLNIWRDETVREVKEGSKSGP